MPRLEALCRAAGGVARIAPFMLLTACSVAANAADEKDACTRAIATPAGLERDVYHGVTVADPYRWLEDWNNPHVRAWSEAQSRCARHYLDAAPQAPSIRARLEELLTGGRGITLSRPRRGGDRLFALRDSPDAQQPVLVWFDANGEHDKAHIVLDPHALDPGAGTSIDWYRPSDDGKLVAVSLSSGGSERGTLRVFDATTGRPTSEVPIANVNNATAGGDLVWSADGSGFFYTRYPQPGERPEHELAFYQRVYYHRLGTAPQTDRYELGADLPSVAAIRLRRQPETGRVLAWVQNGDSGEFCFFVRDTDGAWRRLGEFGDGYFEAQFGSGDDLFLLTRAAAPRGKVVRISLRDLALDRAETVIPQTDGALANSFYWPDSPTLTVLNGKLLLVYQVGGPTSLRIFSRAGTALPVPPLPELSQVAAVTPFDSDEVLFTVESYDAPPRWMRYRSGDEEAQPALVQPNAEKGWSDAVVTREWARSRDGTRVPVNIIRLRDVKTRGLLLTGYGGYGISLAPKFEREVRVLLEQGVAHAVANLRGGSEFGDEWRRQGRLTLKQNVFDDFAAAADLLERGHVPPGKLAIIGTSNGGLLMGAVMTQRPDLAQAVVAKVGVFDSLRNELDANGVFNIPEFGTVKDPRQFAALYAYSPYHHVREATRYPPTLFVTGANDSRVNPMHSRKMTARLQHASISGAPILLRTSDSTGHGAGTPLATQVEELTDTYAFIMRALALEYRDATPRSGGGNKTVP